MAIGEMNDGDLLRRAVGGDEEAFAGLYRRRQGGVYRFALQMSGSPDMAEEVTQETFLALLEHGRRYDPARGTVVSFLFGVARNLVLRRLERGADRAAVGEGEEALEGLVSGGDVLADLARREAIEAVRRAVLSLPSVYREVVVLCDLQEVSYQEAADALGCPLGTVRSRLNRARTLLEEKLRAAMQPARTPG